MPSEIEKLYKLEKDSELVLFEEIKSVREEVLTIKNDLSGKLGQIEDTLKKKLEQEFVFEINPEDIRGLPGKDYILTDSDKVDIAQRVKVPVVEKVIQHTEIVRVEPQEISPLNTDEIVSKVLSEVPEQPDLEELAITTVNYIETLQGDDRIPKSAIKGIEEIEAKILEVYRQNSFPIPASIRIRVLNNGVPFNSPLGSINFVGLTVTQRGQDVTVTNTGSSGGGFTTLSATGTVDGINATFTFTQVPSYIVVDGLWLRPISSSGTVFWTNASTTVTLINPPAYDIFGVA